MIIPFDSLNKYNFALSDINIIYQKPQYRKFSTLSRGCNGFLYITKGECIYKSSGNDIHLLPGSVIYLPKGSCHSMAIVGEEIEFFRIDFTMTIDGELALFSDSPLKITDTCGARFKDCVGALSEECRFEDNSVSKIEKMCGIPSPHI